MLHDLLPHADLNRGFDAWPNHARNFGWVKAHNSHVWVFPKTVEGSDGPTVQDLEMTGSFVVPSAPALARLWIEWGANAGTGGVRWQFGYRVIAVNDSLDLDLDDPADADEVFAQIDQAVGAARTRRAVSVDLNVTNLTKGDRLFWKLRRRATVDTMDAAALLFGLFLDDGL